MLKIRIVGSMFGSSGYDSHTRQLFNALTKFKELDIRLDVPLPQDWIRLVNDEELKSLTKKERVDDITIGILTPPYGRIVLGDNTKKYVQYVVWEGDKIPKYWIEYLLDERVDMIFVPSQHTKQAIDNTCESLFIRDKIIKKLRIVPHGVDLSLFKPTEVKRDSKFTFVCNKGWRGTDWDRGGVQYLLKAFTEEFKKNEPVQLLLKLNPAYLHPSQLKPVLDSLNLPQDRAEIKAIINDIPYNKLYEIYNMADVFVCCSRTEAFNLPGLEAMACGLPNIQTDFGGQIDYLNTSNSFIIPIETKEFSPDISYEGVKWGTPTIEAIRKVLREVYNNKEKIKEKGKQSLIDVQNWTWDNSAKKALQFLNELKCFSI